MYVYLRDAIILVKLAVETNIIIVLLAKIYITENYKDLFVFARLIFLISDRKDAQVYLLTNEF